MAEFTVYGFVNGELVRIETERETLANGFSSYLRNAYDAENVTVTRLVDGRRVLHEFPGVPF